MPQIIVLNGPLLYPKKLVLFPAERQDGHVTYFLFHFFVRISRLINSRYDTVISRVFAQVLKKLRFRCHP